MAVVTYFYICATCGHKFTANEAKCEDWRVPEKSLICPKCNAYLKPKERPYTKHLKWVLPLYVMVIFVCKFYGLVFLGLVAAATPLLIAGWHNENFWKNEIETVVIKQ